MADVLHYRRLMPDDAARLIALVRACYGDSYPMALFYDEAAIASKLRDGLLVSAVAETAGGDLIGHVGTMWEYAGAPTADAMTGMIRPEYQRRGVLAQLTATVGLFYPPVLTGLQLYSVTTHTASQRNGLERGTVECGFLVPEFPSSMNAAGVINDPLGDRNPALAMYCPVQPPPARVVYTPSVYRDKLASLYERLHYPREIRTQSVPVPASVDAHTQCTSLEDPRKGVNRLVIHAMGEDWAQATQAFRQSVDASARTRGWYIDIPLHHPAAIALIERLRQEGWYFGCVLFERQQGDCLRMQYSHARIQREALQIASDTGWQWVDFVLADREATLRASR
ncbi:MAG: hypothetical protein EP312_06945 [Gammaproteobacteria bacterium]|nr:MAG: hypothetical protein EP312_06945 [Gammaproteobacteria bacterium]